MNANPAEEVASSEIIKSQLVSALTSLDVAATANQPEVRKRRRQDAQNVHDEVAKALIEATDLTLQQRGDFAVVMETLRDQLQQSW